MKNDHIRILCAVLALEDDSTAQRNRINPDLVYMVDEAAELCKNADGDIVSRQVVASIVVAWRRLNPEKKAIYR